MRREEVVSTNLKSGGEPFMPFIDPPPETDSRSGGAGLRYCPLEPGELVSRLDCVSCPHRPEEGFLLCSVTRRRQTPRPRGFWDQEAPPGW